MSPYVNITFPARDSGKILKALNLLLRVGEENMTAISDFVAAQQAFHQRMDTALAGISTDIAEMNAKIEQLQNSGSISDADQQGLNELHSRTETIAARLEEIDGMKPPVPPAG